MTAQELKEKLEGFAPEELDGLEVIFMLGGEEAREVSHVDVVDAQFCLFERSN